MSNDLKIINAKIVKKQLDYEKSLPKGIVSAEKFVQVARLAIAKDPKLLKCTEDSIFIAISQAAKDGLLIDGNQAALIAYNTTAKYMPMLAGLRTIINTIDIFDPDVCEIVYENEEFNRGSITGKFQYTHMQINDHKKRGEAIGAYAYVIIKETQKLVFQYMTREEIEDVKTCSQQKEGLLWGKFWSEAWIKTVYRRLFKRLSTLCNNNRLQSAFEHDNQNYEFEDVTPQPQSAKEAAKNLLTKKPAEPLEAQKKEVEIPIKGPNEKDKCLIYPYEIDVDALVALTQTYYEGEQGEGLLTQFFKNNKENIPAILKVMREGDNMKHITWTNNLESIFNELS
jgi:recombination protein RecT